MNKQHLRYQLLAGYNRYRHKFPHTRLALSVIFVVVALSVVFALRVMSHGLPRFCVDIIEEELSTDAFSVELEGVSISLNDGVYLNHVAVYPKRIAQKPIVQARQVHLELDLFSSGPLSSRIEALSIDSFELASVSKDSIYIEVDNEKLMDDYVVILPEIKGVELFCRKARIFNTDAYEISSEISMKNSVVLCNDVSLKLTKPQDGNQQEIFGFVRYDVTKNSLDFSGEGKLKTETLIPLFEDLNLNGLNRELEKFDFPDDIPKITTLVKYSPSESIYNLEINVNSEHVIYNGIDFISLVMYLKAHGSTGWSNVDINSLVARRPEGVLSGNVLIDLDKDVLEFNATSKIRPSHLLTAVDIIKSPDQFPLEVELPCSMSINGSVGISRETAKALRVDGSFTTKSISYNGLMFENAKGRVSMDYDSWDIEDLEAKFYGGLLRGDIVVTPDYVSDEGLALDSVNFAMNYNCTDANLDTIVRSLQESKSAVEPYAGCVNANGYLNFDITGVAADNLRSMIGAATLDVSNATLYRIPMFAGFTDFMARNVPGLDFILTQSSLKTELSIKDYCVNFSDLLIDGPAISVTGQGNLWFTGHMDGHMRVNLLSQETWVGKGLRYVLFPLSKMFELQVYGPINELIWTTSTLGLGDKITTPEQRGEK